jgi:chitinase
MQKYVDWFNLMSYDLHGMWDHSNKWTGPYLRGHTDLSEIDLGLDLLWRNNIKPENVVLGFGFYGRSFTMADPGCHEPNGICQFTTGGNPGSCSNTRGVLTYQEISTRNETPGIQTYYDVETTVKYSVFDGDQWISYDDAQSFHDKKEFLSKRCLSGLMVWALDQDNSTFGAYDGLLGDTGELELDGGSQTPEEQEELVNQMAAYTGQNCYVTPRCTDGSESQRGPNQVCSIAFQSVATAHAPLQLDYGADVGNVCDKGWFKHICCPKEAAPKNCEWTGAPERNVLGCDGRCGDRQFKLNIDTAVDAKGQQMCYTGTRALCCDSAAVLSDCYWSDCQGPLNGGAPTCEDGFKYQAYRLDKPDGTRWCSDQFKSSDHENYGSALCCPEASTFSNCHWSNDPGRRSPASPVKPSIDHWCTPQACSATQLKVADALSPPRSSFLASDQSCDGFLPPAGYDPHFPLCCDPPSRFNKKWPVDPSKLFPTYYDVPNDSDVLWHYSDDYRNNNEDRVNDEAEDGSDAFGFIMLDGPEGSLDNSFSTTHTFVRQKRDLPKVKRSLITRNQTVLDSVFDHSEEVLHVYCNYPAGSPECGHIWKEGAEDTIIRLPDHVGEGPFARIVSMKPASSELSRSLPAHHLEHRAADGLHDNPVYEVTIDYNFMAITPKRADEPVFLRVDYTNMLGYWDEIMEAEPSINDEAPSPGGSRKRKRNTKRSITDWHGRVHRAAQRDSVLRKRSAPINITVPMDPIVAEVSTEDGTGSRHDKRWWGAFTGWLSRVTRVEKSELGVIPLAWGQTINLFRAQWGCPGQTFSANLRMDLEAELNMDATYAYYFSGSFIPPSKPDVYAYLGMEPYAYLGLRMVGNAVMQMTSGRKKIIDTLAYPGLAIKGIAAVGPTLDVFGEIRGKITLHGEASAGARLNFGKAEVYWPQDDEASKKYEKLVGMETKRTMRPDPSTLAPTFEAGVRLDAQLDVIVTPQANVGIKIGGGSLVSTTIMDAQLSGFVTGDLSFQASGDVTTETGAFRYSYGVYIFYNLGYSATAKILGLFNWALSPRKAWPQDQRINVYGPVTGEIPLTKRSLDDDMDPYGSGFNSSLLLPRADGDGDGSQGALGM